MESGAISDEQISASSEFDVDHGTSRSRIHTQIEGGKAAAWSAGILDANPWLQIDLGNQYTKVTGVATQGRNAPVVQQWVTKYQLQYSDDGVSFEYYKEHGQTESKVPEPAFFF